ncbi:MAG: hypothetical protein IKT40_12570 [Bacilli bacterium]|nr:hypothetical protein [Bacilli bacterium]
MEKIIKLTENELHSLIKESVNYLLNELDWKTYMNASRVDKDPKRSKEFYNMSRDNFNKEFGYNDGDGNYTKLDNEDGSLRSFDGRNSGYHYFKQDLEGGDIEKPVYKVRKSGNDVMKTSERPYSVDKRHARKMAKAHGEHSAYKNGDYEYIKGKGWVDNNENPSDWHNYMEYNN